MAWESGVLTRPVPVNNAGVNESSFPQFRNLQLVLDNINIQPGLRIAVMAGDDMETHVKVSSFASKLLCIFDISYVGSSRPCNRTEET